MRISIKIFLVCWLAHSMSPLQVRAAEFSLLPSSNEKFLAIQMTGKIVAGDSQQLTKLYYQHFRSDLEHTIIYMKSGGGNGTEAIRLGRFIRYRQIRTSVDTFCMSGCAIAFMGGYDSATDQIWREKPAGARLGVHRPRPNMDQFVFRDKLKYQHLLGFYSSALGAINRQLKYLDEMGVPLDFLRFVLKTPSRQMYYISNEEAKSLGVRVIGETVTGPLVKRHNDASVLPNLSRR